MEERDLVVQKLSELKQVKFIQPTAMELHANGRGLGRVQRKEQKRYEDVVKKQKVHYKQKLTEIDQYIASKDAYDAYIASQKGKKPKDGVIEAPALLPQPTVVIGSKPRLKKTRLPLYTQRRGRY